MQDNVMSRVRSRLDVLTDTDRSTRFYNGSPISIHNYAALKKEITSDCNNHWLQWLRVQRAAPWTKAWDVGGPFESWKTWVEFGGERVKLKYFPYQGDYLHRFEGLLLPGIPVPVINGIHTFSSNRMNGDIWNPTSLGLSSYDDLNEFGAEAIQATIPNAPHADVFQQLEELRREGLPSVPLLQFLKNRGFKGAAGEHLNLEFGWKPATDAVRQDAEIIRNAADILRQYRRDSGLLVRRRLTVPEILETTTGTYSTSVYPLNTVAGFFSSKGPTMRTVETRRRRWFSAAYLYYVGVDASKFEQYWDEADTLLGTEPTPEKMFALLPWSWMLDWFTNSGELLAALQTFRQDPMLLRWGYVMETIHRTTTYEQELVTNEGLRVTASLKLHQERKIRRSASPFGFGLTEDDLSVRQKSILLALGISKMPFG